MMRLLGLVLEVRCEGGRSGRGLWLLAIGRGGVSRGGDCCCCLASRVYLHGMDETRVGKLGYPRNVTLVMADI